MPTKINSTAGKIAAIALAGAMLVTLSACGSKKENTNTNNENSTPVATVNNNDNTTNASNTANENIANANITAPVTAYVYDYTPGNLNVVMTEDGTEAAVPGFNITGVMLMGNQHENDPASQYSTSGIKNEFFLNEWIEFYFDDASIAALGSDSQIIAVPHREISEYASMTPEILQETASTTGGFMIGIDPASIDNTSGFNLVGSGYANMEIGQAGLWDILILKGGHVAYYIPVNMLPVM